jgi:hypothetical protein
MKNLFLYSLLIASSIFTVHAQGQILVIANSSVKAADISINDLREVFGGTSSSLKDGSHVTPVLMKPGAVSDGFMTEYIGKADSAFRAGWRSLVFSGEASMPKSVDSDSAMVEYVSKNAGAIGYIGRSSPHEGVKTLAVK